MACKDKDDQKQGNGESRSARQDGEAAHWLQTLCSKRKPSRCRPACAWTRKASRTHVKARALSLGGGKNLSAGRSRKSQLLQGPSPAPAPLGLTPRLSTRSTGDSEGGGAPAGVMSSPWVLVRSATRGTNPETRS